MLHDGGEVTLVGPKGETRRVQMSTRCGTAGRVLARVDGLDDRELARELIGWLIHGEDELLPELVEGEYYHRDLIGLEVYRDGELLGTLTEIHGTGPVDVWTVRSGEDEIFVPALNELIERVDLEAGRVEVRG